MKNLIQGLAVHVGVLVLTSALALADSPSDPASSAPVYLSPTALVATGDGKGLFIACATANRVLRLDLASQKLVSIPMPDPPSGLALSPDGTRLFVTCAAPESKICIIDSSTLQVVETLPGGHTATAPVISRDGKILYVCNQFNNDVSVFDLLKAKEIRRIAVQREPVAADITKDGKYLLVANQLPASPANATYVSAVISVIDLAAGKVIKELQLPHGGGGVKDICISPDGKNAAVTHILARFYHPVTDVFQGWINANALTIIDMGTLTVRGTALLDEQDQGAANPWGAAWSADGSKLLVTHAGTHEVSVIDFSSMLAGLIPVSSMGEREDPAGRSRKTTREQAELSNYSIPYLAAARQRVKLAGGDFGPRAVAVVGQMAYVANYFSDTLGVIDLAAKPLRAESISLGAKLPMTEARQGEFYFHDARLCSQGWQSCSSCHPGGARVDGLNWDLLNDGAGNPKNTKSLLLSPWTPPLMSLGEEVNIEVNIRGGIKHMLLTEQSEAVTKAMVEYIKSLKPVPSPYLVHGGLSSSAQRGKILFHSAGCAECHPPGLFTDLRPHNVGTQGVFDKPTDRFYTPTLVEVWRTAPYLHDGSALTVREVITTHNPADKLGMTSGLSSREIDDLCEYVLSL
jgi:DNA-binding beta-propeller fold protein YncE